MAVTHRENPFGLKFREVSGIRNVSHLKVLMCCRTGGTERSRTQRPEGAARVGSKRRQCGSLPEKSISSPLATILPEAQKTAFPRSHFQSLPRPVIFSLWRFHEMQTLALLTPSLGSEILQIDLMVQMHTPRGE